MADTYEVVSQTLRTEKNAADQYISVYRIAFTTKPSNQPGYVDIPVSAYSADEVDKLIGPLADTIERVQHL